MDARFNNPFLSEHDENESTPENSAGSPPPMIQETKTNSISSPKRSRRGIPKRIVSIPIKEIEGSRIKSDSAPPSDSWAWRKYGQKPIKGSPYPRGYYRCSSSKGCPARKQVERSSVDPTMMVVTYSSDHNHPWPPSKNHNHHQSAATTAAAAVTPEKPEIIPDPKLEQEPEPEEKFPDLGSDEFTWFSDMETTTSSILEIPIFADRSVRNDDVGMFFPMREEDESLFADLGELPECSTVLRHLGVGPQFEIC